MEISYKIFKTNDIVEGVWVLEGSFQTYEEAVEYLNTSLEVVSRQYWKIEKVWEWPF